MALFSRRAETLTLCILPMLHLEFLANSDSTQTMIPLVGVTVLSPVAGEIGPELHLCSHEVALLDIFPLNILSFDYFLLH